MIRRPAVIGIAVALSTIVAGATPASADLLTNGNFEADPFLTGWTVSGSAPTEETAAPIEGASSARMAAGAIRSISQSVTALGDFTLTFQVNPLFSTLDRSLNLLLRDASNDPIVNLKLAGLNTAGSGSDLQVYDGSTFRTISPTNFFADNSVYTIQVIGRDWGTASARYDLLWSNAGSTSLTNAKGGVTFFHTGAFAPADQLTKVEFIVGSTGDRNSHLVDSVALLGFAVPAPAALPAGLALLGFAAARRRRR